MSSDVPERFVFCQEHEDFALNTEKFLKKFIQIYKSFPVLWNPAHPDYANKHRRKQAHNRLLALFRSVRPDSIRDDVLRKINTLRSNYNRVVRQVKQAEAEGKEYVPTNWQYHELRFLDTIKKPEYHNTSEEDSPKDEYETIETYEVCEPGTEFAEVKIETSAPSPSMGNELLFVEMPDQSEEVQLTEEVYDQPKMKVMSLPRKRSAQVVKHVNVCKKRVSLPTGSALEPIAMVWSSKLQALEATQRLYAEKAINDVLFEAGMGNLGKGILVINPSSSSVSAADDEPHEYSEFITD